jgi:hypothetical protein
VKFTRDGDVESVGKILRIIPIIETVSGTRVELPATYYPIDNAVAGWQTAALSTYSPYVYITIMLGPGPLASRLSFVVQVLENMEDVGPYTLEIVDGEPVFHRIGQ